jgi:hypothetical protein
MASFVVSPSDSERRLIDTTSRPNVTYHAESHAPHRNQFARELFLFDRRRYPLVWCDEGTVQRLHDLGSYPGFGIRFRGACGDNRADTEKPVVG